MKKTVKQQQKVSEKISEKTSRTSIQSVMVIRILFSSPFTFILLNNDTVSYALCQLEYTRKRSIYRDYFLPQFPLFMMIFSMGSLSQTPPSTQAN